MATDALLEMVLHNQELDAELLTGRSASERVAAVVYWLKERRWPSLWAASEGAHRLVGAVLVSSDGRGRLWQAGDDSREVVVLESVACGSTAVCQVMGQIRRVSQVEVSGLIALAAAPMEVPAGVDVLEWQLGPSGRGDLDGATSGQVVDLRVAAG